MYLKKLKVGEIPEGESTFAVIQVDAGDVLGVQSLKDQGYEDATQEEYLADGGLVENESAGATGTDMEEGQGNAPLEDIEITKDEGEVVAELPAEEEAPIAEEVVAEDAPAEEVA